MPDSLIACDHLLPQRTVSLSQFHEQVNEIYNSEDTDGILESIKLALTSHTSLDSHMSQIDALRNTWDLTTPLQASHNYDSAIGISNKLVFKDKVAVPMYHCPHFGDTLTVDNHINVEIQDYQSANVQDVQCNVCLPQPVLPHACVLTLELHPLNPGEAFLDPQKGVHSCTAVHTCSHILSSPVQPCQ